MPLTGRHVLRPDHPDRIAVSAGGDAAAFVIGPTPDGPSEATGLWHGPLGGEPARISDLVSRHQPGLRARTAAPVCAGRAGRGGQRLIVADPAAAPAGWPRHPLPAFAEQVAWTDDGLIVLAADPGADAASLTSGKPLRGAGAGPGRWRGPAAGWLPAAVAGRRRDRDRGAGQPGRPGRLGFAPVPGGGASWSAATTRPRRAGITRAWISWTRRRPASRVLRESAVAAVLPSGEPRRPAGRPTSRAGPATAACSRARCSWPA